MFFKREVHLLGVSTKTDCLYKSIIYVSKSNQFLISSSILYNIVIKYDIVIKHYVVSKKSMHLKMGDSKKNILLMQCSGKQEHKTIKMIQQITSLYLRLRMTNEIYTLLMYEFLLLVIAWIITTYQYNNLL